jgi:hypothetical protein
MEYIYYTGIGSKKSGKHTVKEFLKIMNKHFNIQCSNFLPELNYEPCHKYKEIRKKEINESIKLGKSMFDIKRSNKNEKKYQKLVKECVDYKKTVKKRKCN